jgi:signal transduction histidine kinase
VNHRATTRLRPGNRRVAGRPGRAHRIGELLASRERLAVAVLDERRRIERDLHDGVQHRMLYLAWLAERASAVAVQGRTGAELTDLLTTLVRAVRETNAELRDLARGIHPSIVVEQGLAVAIEEYGVRSPIALRVGIPPRRFPAPVETTAYFAIVEAVVNAAKHSGADRADVVAEHTAGLLRIGISDDGRGGADPSRGTGLRNIADRLSALGGWLVVRSAPGEGTTLTLGLPCA